MTTEDMLPILPLMDEIGYDSMEMWGGATFDVTVRFLKEDPWERVRAFKRHMKKTPLKMVLRGQNLIGYKAYPDDIVEKFVEKAAEAGIDIFLIFDALQDLRNCETAFRAVKKAGKKIEGSIPYNISPFHTTEQFVQNALEQEQMGVSLIHVEDMAGLMKPQAAYELISALKKALHIPIHLHCHCTGGMAEMAYWEAIRAGVDGVDVCVSSMSMGPVQPPVESIQGPGRYGLSPSCHPLQPDVRGSGHYQRADGQPLLHGQQGIERLLPWHVRETAGAHFPGAAGKSPGR